MSATAPSLRPVVLGLLLAGALLAGAAVLPSSGDRPASPAAVPAADRTTPLAVLRAWDRERAAAWHAGDVAALGDLYVAGSRAGRSDRTLLASYVDRGLRVTGLRVQVASVEVVRADDARLVLLVTDRLAGPAVVADDGEVLPLPRDRWSTRRVVLVRSGERWQMASVAAQAPRPAASTASTSASENP